MAPMESHQQKIIHTTPQDPCDSAAPFTHLKPAAHIRTCIVTRQPFPKKDLLRFTLVEKNIVCPDVLQNRPGRGLYVRPERTYLQQAIKKNSFASAARRQAILPDDLLLQIETSLRNKALHLLNKADYEGSIILDKNISTNNNSIIAYIKSETEDCSNINNSPQDADKYKNNSNYATCDLNLILKTEKIKSAALRESAVTRNLLDVVKHLQKVQSNITVKEDQNA